MWIIILARKQRITMYAVRLPQLLQKKVMCMQSIPHFTKTHTTLTPDCIGCTFHTFKRDYAGLFFTLWKLLFNASRVQTGRKTTLKENRKRHRGKKDKDLRDKRKRKLQGKREKNLRSKKEKP